MPSTPARRRSAPPPTTIRPEPQAGEASGQRPALSTPTSHRPRQIQVVHGTSFTSTRSVPFPRRRGALAATATRSVVARAPTHQRRRPRNQTWLDPATWPCSMERPFSASRPTPRRTGRPVSMDSEILRSPRWSTASPVCAGPARSSTTPSMDSTSPRARGSAPKTHLGHRATMPT
jgi:hypothetical protein